MGTCNCEMQQWAKVFSVNSTVLWEMEQTSIVYAEYYTVGLGWEGRAWEIHKTDGREELAINWPAINWILWRIHFCIKATWSKDAPTLEASKIQVRSECLYIHVRVCMFMFGLFTWQWMFQNTALYQPLVVGPVARLSDLPLARWERDSWRPESGCLWWPWLSRSRRGRNRILSPTFQGRQKADWLWESRRNKRSFNKKIWLEM